MIRLYREESFHINSVSFTFFNERLKSAYFDNWSVRDSYLFEVLLHIRSQKSKRRRFYNTTIERNRIYLIEIYFTIMLLNVTCEHVPRKLMHRVSSNSRFRNFIFFSLIRFSTSLSSSDIFSGTEFSLNMIVCQNDTHTKIEYDRNIIQVHTFSQYTRLTLGFMLLLRRYN